jgi:hypothetical protein
VIYFVSVSISGDRPLLGISKVEGYQDKSPASPGMGIRAEKSAVMARRVRVCSLLATSFFVMPAAAQTPGAELDEVSKPTASAGTKVSASEPHEVPEPAITSLIYAAGLITLLRRRPSDRQTSSRRQRGNNHPSGAVKPIDSRRCRIFIIDDFSSFSDPSVFSTQSKNSHC